MRKGFLIYEEMRKFFPIYEEAVSHMTLHPILLNFLIYEENFILFFISVIEQAVWSCTVSGPSVAVQITTAGLLSSSLAQAGYEAGPGQPSTGLRPIGCP